MKKAVLYWKMGEGMVGAGGGVRVNLRHYKAGNKETALPCQSLLIQTIC